MLYHEFISKNKEIQNKLLLFLDKEDDIEENYKNLIELFTNYQILDNRYELKSLLYLISNISNNHYQTPSFTSKIERLLQYLKEDIKKEFSNLKIFDIFKNSKSLLLILIEQEIMTIDESILKRISSKKYFKRSYHHFFFPEILPLIKKVSIKERIDESDSTDEENSSDDDDYENSSDDDDYENSSDDDNDYDKSSSDLSENDTDDDNEETNFYKEEIFINLVKKFTKKLPENFLKQRKIGQNENHICKLIREDLIDEFIAYVNQHDYPLNSNIEKSIYETNSLLIENKPTLIEYAAFFGSIQVFRYLFLNKAKIKPSIWIYGIHSDNPELINILEENNIRPEDKAYSKCMKEAIKCHHIDVSNYIQNNYHNDEEVESDHLILSYSFQYYNYLYFPKELDNHFILFCACKYDYYTIVEYLLREKKVCLQDKIVLYTYIFNDVYLFIFLMFLLYNMQLGVIILK